MFRAGDGELGTEDSVSTFEKLPVLWRVQLLPREYRGPCTIIAAMKSTEREEHRSW